MSATLEGPVTLSQFGAERKRTTVSAGTTVEKLLAELGVEVQGQRVARNGHPVALDAVVHPNDELTVVPRVQGG